MLIDVKYSRRHLQCSAVVITLSISSPLTCKLKFAFKKINDHVNTLKFEQ